MDFDSLRVVVLQLKEQLFAGAGAWAGVWFCVLFTGSATIGMPVFYLTILSGFVFGLWPGYALVMGSLLMTKTLVHVLVRGVVRGFFEKRLAKDKRLQILDRAVGEEGSKLVFFLRMTPVLPFGIGSYLFSMTSVKTVPYFICSMAGVAAGTFFYVWLGSLLDESLAPPANIQQWVVVFKWLGFGAFGVGLYILTKTIRRALARFHLEEETTGPVVEEGSEIAPRKPEEIV
jgi:uncharacterized membrane protein YdjX (TVP38/TMEM64 family)